MNKYIGIMNYKCKMCGKEMCEHNQDLCNECGGGKVNDYNRIKKWQEFSQYMETEYLDRTIAKYGKQKAPDLMQVTPVLICIWNIIKYAFRLWNGKGKGREFEKIAHYAQIAWARERDGLE